MNVPNLVVISAGRGEDLIFTIVTDDGETLKDVVFNSYAIPIPGFIPVKIKSDDNKTCYINVDKILAISVAGAQQENMRTDIIKPKEYKARG